MGCGQLEGVGGGSAYGLRQGAAAIREEGDTMTFELGGYRAERRIGAGGTAMVYRGVEIGTGRVVALKVLPPDRLEQLEREAALAALVDHPHLPEVLGLVADQERAALVTEFAAGGTLAGLLRRRGRLTEPETLTVLLRLAAALATAHERGVIHGDLSAGNVLFDLAGRPLLADLGAARAAAELVRPVSATPCDAAPELARGQEPDEACDMFSLGSLALACLTGRHAWPAESLRDVVIQATAGQWPDPGESVSAELAAVVRALLDPLPVARPRGAAVVMDLRACGWPQPVDLAAPTAEGASATISRPRHLAVDPDPDPELEGLGEAVTRVRPDACPVPDEPEPGDRRDLLRRIRSIAAGRADAGRHRPGRSLIRSLLLVVAVLAVGLVAVQTGLWWAGRDTARPASLVAQPVDSASAAPTAPTTAATAVIATDATRTAAPMTSTSTSGPGVSASGRGAEAPWLDVVAELDRIRGRALVERDPALLARVYTAGSPARAADEATIRTLLDKGWKVSGAVHVIATVSPLPGRGTIRLRVVDSMPAYQVTDASGAVVGRTRLRPTASRVIVLMKGDDGYRISAVEA